MSIQKEIFAQMAASQEGLSSMSEWVSEWLIAYYQKEEEAESCLYILYYSYHYMVSHYGLIQQ
jgi:hypothetical protein